MSIDYAAEKAASEARQRAKRDALWIPINQRWKEVDQRDPELTVEGRKKRRQRLKKLARQARYRQKHKDAIKQKDKLYRDAHPEKKVKDAAWRRQHRQRMKALQAKWRQKNRAKLRQKDKDYYRRTHATDHSNRDS